MSKNLVVVIDRNPIVVLDLTQIFQDVMPGADIRSFPTFEEADAAVQLEDARVVVAGNMPQPRDGTDPALSQRLKSGMRLIVLSDRGDEEKITGSVVVSTPFSINMIADAVARLNACAQLFPPGGLPKTLP